ncbi:MAG: ABC transporter permease, partial [Gemmatimonadetes bacterium]|nr:ABC transporter permease [Gemmatimonadota bacterium]
MRWFQRLTFRIRSLLTPGRMERELRDEMRFHIEMETDKLTREGHAPEVAARLAEQRFGARARQRDRARWSWGPSLIRDATADSRLVWRQMRRNPGFAIGVIATLALAIGVNTAIFGIADRALLRAPPVLEPDRLAAIYTTCRRGATQCSSSYPDYEDYRDMSSSFEDMAAYSSVPLNVGDVGTARLATGILVTGNYFDVVGVRPAEGRLIQPADDRAGGGELVAVLGHGFWRDALGAPANVVGQDIRLNETRFTVIGIGPPDFHGLNLTAQADLWIPLTAVQALGPGVGGAADIDVLRERRARWIGTVVGRLSAGTPLARAAAEMDAIAARLGEEYPDERAAVDGVRGITVDPIGAYILPLGNEETLRQFVSLLVGVVGLTLLLAAANLANLFLARATARGQEIGVRVAIGAGRERVVRQLVTESLVLSLIGAGAGLLVAQGVIATVRDFDLPGGVAIASLGIGLDPRALGFAILLAVLTALLFGLMPALHASRRDVVAAVKGTSLGRRGQAPLRKTLVAVQIALCLVLLVGSGLFLKTLRNSLDADLGFEPRGAIAARFNLSLLGYTEERAQGFVDELLAGVRALPGVGHASLGTMVPFQGAGFRGTFADIEGYVPAPDEEIRVDWVVVDQDYFASIGTRLVEGREFNRNDRADAPAVVIVNEHMARMYWGGRSPLGARIQVLGTELEVVGVSEDASWLEVNEDARPFVFVPQAQFQTAAQSFLTLVARTDGDPEALLPAIRARFEAADPNLSLTFLRTLKDQVGIALMPQRMGTVLLTLLGALALTLATIGVFAVVSYTVRRRARDIGIRIAVGATEQRIVRSVLGEMALPVVGGLGLGAAVALGLSGTVEAFMYEVAPTDPVTFAAIALLLIGVG